MFPNKFPKQLACIVLNFQFYFACVFLRHFFVLLLYPLLIYFQADYVLGKNPMKMSYLVGYGSDYPQYVHHRGSSIPVDFDTDCREGFKWLNSADPNPNVVIEALVGGPFLNETYIDSRNNSMQGEPTTYNSALIVGLLSGLTSSSSVVTTFA